MAFPTAVNSQITDAVAPEAGVSGASTPSLGAGTFYQATANAMAIGFQNATSAQQQANVAMQAATAQGVALLYGVDTAATGVASAEILGEK